MSKFHLSSAVADVAVPPSACLYSICQSRSEGGASASSGPRHGDILLMSSCVGIRRDMASFVLFVQSPRQHLCSLHLLLRLTKTKLKNSVISIASLRFG